jgi:glucarate dehydratase
MAIADIRATTVAVPLEAPLRHAAGAHWGRFVRTLVEVVGDDGLSGWGELGGGGESAEAAVRGLLPYLMGHDPLQLEQLRWKIMNPTASLYNNRLQIHAAIEMACLDLAGKRLGVPATFWAARSGSACRSPPTSSTATKMTERAARRCPRRSRPMRAT